MNYYILAINPGSTSTKVALYKDTNEIFKKTIQHSNEEIDKYENVASQYEMRYEAILNLLKENDFKVELLSAVVGRGGLLPPVKSGAYLINSSMIDRLKYRPVVEHASNLGAIIAFAISKPLKIPSYIYDCVSVDELTDIARISGLAEIERKSFSHALNMRAVAIKTAKKMGREYCDLNFIVAHLGGGISVSLHSNGKMIDLVSDDEGPFSPERSGGLQCKELMKMCYKNDEAVMLKKLRGKGGFVSYLGTNSAQDVEDMVNKGDKRAKLIYEAMAYQISKAIGDLATVVSGKVDCIIITGGIAYSKMMTTWIKKRVEFIAPLEIVPGENELEALALGTLRVLKGEEKAHEYNLN